MPPPAVLRILPQTRFCASALPLSSECNFRRCSRRKRAPQSASARVGRAPMLITSPEAPLGTWPVAWPMPQNTMLYKRSSSRPGLLRQHARLNTPRHSPGGQVAPMQSSRTTSINHDFDHPVPFASGLPAFSRIGATAIVGRPHVRVRTGEWRRTSPIGVAASARRCPEQRMRPRASRRVIRTSLGRGGG